MLKEQLSEFELFEGLSDEQLAAAADLFQTKNVLMGEKLTAEDDFGYSLVLVLSGSVAVRIGDKEVAVLPAGDHFGEVSMIAHQKRNATVTAREMCDVARVMKWDFDKFIAIDPLIKQRLLVKAEERAIARESSGEWDLSGSP